MRQKDQDRKHIKAYFSFKFIKDEVFYRNTYQKLKCYLSFSSSFSSLLEEGLCGNSLKSLFDCFLFSFFTEMNIKKKNKTLHWAEHILTHRFYYAIQHFWGPSVWEDCVLPRSAILLPTVVFSDILITPAVIGIFFWAHRWSHLPFLHRWSHLPFLQPIWSQEWSDFKTSSMEDPQHFQTVDSDQLDRTLHKKWLSVNVIDRKHFGESVNQILFTCTFLVLEQFAKNKKKSMYLFKLLYTTCRLVDVVATQVESSIWQFISYLQFAVCSIKS